MFTKQASAPSIAVEAAKYQLLRERLLAESPGLDEETLADTLEGLTDLKEMVAALIRSALLDEALMTGLKSRVEQMRGRLDRLDVRATKKRELALSIMQEVGFAKLIEGDFTASTRPSPPSLVVTAEHEIPKQYWLPQPPKLDRQSLIATLKRGDAVPGAALNNPRSVLAVRIK
jgi:hypothetical protein